MSKINVTILAWFVITKDELVENAHLKTTFKLSLMYNYLLCLILFNVYMSSYNKEYNFFIFFCFIIII